MSPAPPAANPGPWRNRNRKIQLICLITALLTAACAGALIPLSAPSPASTGPHAATDSPAIPWEDAERLILSGEVAQIFQLHSLDVMLILRDGRRLTTVEPRIDAVFEVVDRCGDPCNQMLLATE